MQEVWMRIEFPATSRVRRFTAYIIIQHPCFMLKWPFGNLFLEPTLFFGNVGIAIINHPPFITIFMGGIPTIKLMGGFWRCYTHISIDNPQMKSRSAPGVLKADTSLCSPLGRLRWLWPRTGQFSEAWIITTSLRPSPGNHWFILGKSSPLMAELFRLVNYSNSPRLGWWNTTSLEKEREKVGCSNLASYISVI